jgi:hypothetical protein
MCKNWGPFYHVEKPREKPWQPSPTIYTNCVLFSMTFHANLLRLAHVYLSASSDLFLIISSVLLVIHIYTSCVVHFATSLRRHCKCWKWWGIIPKLSQFSGEFQNWSRYMMIFVIIHHYISWIYILDLYLGSIPASLLFFFIFVDIDLHDLSPAACWARKWRHDPHGLVKRKNLTCAKEKILNTSCFSNSSMFNACQYVFHLMYLKTSIKIHVAVGLLYKNTQAALRMNR